jgi:hypothetical protein
MRKGSLLILSWWYFLARWALAFNFFFLEPTDGSASNDCIGSICWIKTQISECIPSKITKLKLLTSKIENKMWIKGWSLCPHLSENAYALKLNEQGAFHGFCFWSRITENQIHDLACHSNKTYRYDNAIPFINWLGEFELDLDVKLEKQVHPLVVKLSSKILSANPLTGCNIQSDQRLLRTI